MLSKNIRLVSLLLIFAIFTLCGCKNPPRIAVENYTRLEHALKIAGNNKIQLQKVIDY